MKPILILCLGNEILSDDAVGPTVANRLQPVCTVSNDVEVIFAPVAGFNLLDLLNNRRSVLIIDSIITGQAKPGTLHFFEADVMIPSNGLINSHQINLPTALELGRKLGYNLPERIDILAVEVEDITTISDRLTHLVQDAIEPTVEKVSLWIKALKKEVIYG